MSEFVGWDTPYVQSPSRSSVLSSDSGPPSALAITSVLGPGGSVRACDETHSAIVRQCADVSKLMCHTHVNGDMLDHDLLAAFDGQLRASVSASLCGDLLDHSWWRATRGVTCGGLGLRTALVVALLAFGTSSQPIMAKNDARTDDALALLVSTLPTYAAQLLDEALADRELLWRSVLAGTQDAMQDLSSPSLRHARGITPDGGGGEDEHLLARKRVKIQALITACVERPSRDAPNARERVAPATARLLELGNAEIHHTWMWRLKPHHGSVLEPEEYVDSVRLRLGCTRPCEPVPCAACQSWSLDTGAARATCCALDEATRGHNAVTALVHAAAQSSDCTAETEVPGLIPGTDLRPADVLTSALGNSYTALDISICSPHALQAGSDCAQNRLEAKLAWPTPPLSPPSEHFLHPDHLERPWAASPRHVDLFALSQQIHRAQTRLRLR